MPLGLPPIRPPGRIIRILRPLMVAASGNPLARRWDRIEAVLVLALAAVAALALPVAAAAGSSTFTDQMALAAAQVGNRHQVTATLIPGSRALAPAVDLSPNITSATASWTFPDGVVHTEVITVPSAAVTGSTTRIWIDGSGAQASAPLTETDAMTTAIVAGALIELAVLISLTAVYGTGRFLLDRRRTRHWDTEWARFTERGTVP
jgi:hypothetical protein